MDEKELFDRAIALYDRTSEHRLRQGLEDMLELLLLRVAGNHINIDHLIPKTI